MKLGKDTRLRIGGSAQRVRYQLAVQMWNLYEASIVGSILTIAEPQIDFRTPVEQLTKSLILRQISVQGVLHNTLYSPLVKEVQYSGPLCGEVINSLEWGEAEVFERDLQEGLQTLITQMI